MPAFEQQGAAQIPVHLGVFVAGFERRLEVRDGFVDLPGSRERETQVVIRLGIGRAEFQRVAPFRRSRIQPACLTTFSVARGMTVVAKRNTSRPFILT